VSGLSGQCDPFPRGENRNAMVANTHQGQGSSRTFFRRGGQSFALRGYFSALQNVPLAPRQRWRGHCRFCRNTGKLASSPSNPRPLFPRSVPPDALEPRAPNRALAAPTASSGDLPKGAGQAGGQQGVRAPTL